MGQFDPAEFDVGAGVGGIRTQVLSADLTVEIVLALAGLERVLDLAEVVNDKWREVVCEAEGADAFGDILVDGTGEEDAGMAAKEAGAAAANIGGIGLGDLDKDGIGERALVAGPAVGGADVVPAPDVIGEDVGAGDGLGEEALRGGVEHLVGVEDEDPIAAAVLEDAVAGVGKVVLPRDGDDLGVEGAGDVDGVVGGSGVSEDDAVDEASDALQAALEAGRTIFDDHGEFDAGGGH